MRIETPSRKYFCPRCQTGYAVDQNFCGSCGADMKNVSPLAHAAAHTEEREVALEPRATGTFGSTERPDPDDVSTKRMPGEKRRASDDEGDRWLGKIVDGRYRVVEAIGHGGMGVVYKVEHIRLGKIAAMKVLHNELANDGEVIMRFHREADAVSRLTHPNTVQVFDFGTQDGALYLVMEYVRGLDIGALLDRDNHIEFERAVPLLGQILSALEEAHEFGIVHRDLKPENILVTRTHGGQDYVKVLDFGLAKLTEREELSSVTDRGLIVGTPYFMSPEQIRGDDVDTRSDIYSIGAVMYKMLSGEYPFTGATPVVVLTRHLTDRVEPPSSRAPHLKLDPGFDDIVLKCMEKDRDKRYQHVRDVLRDLEELYSEVSSDNGSGVRHFYRARTSDGTAVQYSEAVDFGIDSDLRLRRSDVDKYEKVLKRHRLFRVVFLPIAGLALAGLLAFTMIGQSAKELRNEVEPNNQLADANLAPIGQPVTGYIGKRQSEVKPDADFYKFSVAPDANGDTMVSARLSGIPNMDLTLSFYDLAGRLITRADAGAIGGEESIEQFRMTKPFVVGVAQKRPRASLPVENVSDSYQLQVDYKAPLRGLEIEPNESDADATSVEPGPARGRLDRANDADHWRFRGPAGRYRVTIEAPSELPLRWNVDGTHTRERTLDTDMRPGSIVRVYRVDGAGTGALPGAPYGYTVQITPVAP